MKMRDENNKQFKTEEPSFKKITTLVVRMIMVVVICITIIGCTSKEDKQPQEPLQGEESETQEEEVIEEKKPVVITELQEWHDDYIKSLLKLFNAPQIFGSKTFRSDISVLDSQWEEKKFCFGLSHITDDDVPELVLALDDYDEKFVFAMSDGGGTYYQGKAEETLELELYELTIENLEQQFRVKIPNKSILLYEQMLQLYIKHLNTKSQYQYRDFKCGEIYINQDEEVDYIIVQEFGDEYSFTILVSGEEQYYCIMDTVEEEPGEEYSYLEKEGILIQKEEGDFGTYYYVDELNDNYKLETKFSFLKMGTSAWLNPGLIFGSGTPISKEEFNSDYYRYCYAQDINNGREFYSLGEFLSQLDLNLEFVN